MDTSFFHRLFRKKDPAQQQVEESAEELKAIILSIEQQFILNHEEKIPHNSTLLTIYQKLDGLSKEDISRPLIDSIRMAFPLTHPIEGRAHANRNQAVIDGVENLKSGFKLKESLNSIEIIIDTLISLVSLSHATIDTIDRLVNDAKEKNYEAITIHTLGLSIFDESKDMLTAYKMENKFNAFENIRENFMISIEKSLEKKDSEEKDTSQKIVKK